MYQRVMFGPVTNDENKKLVDLNGRETALLIPLVIFMVWIGIRPVDFTKYSEEWVETILSGSEAKSIAVLQQANPVDLPDWTTSLYDINSQDTERLIYAKKEN